MKTDFPATFFQANRKKLRELFGGGAPIVLTANGLMQKTADVTYPFVQDNNFWYLTGIEEPGVILVMEVDKEYLILPERQKIQDIFHGEVDHARLTDLSGIDEIYNNEEGWKQLSKRLKKVKHVATINPPKAYIQIYEMYTNPAKAKLLRNIKSHNDQLSLIDMRQYLSALRSVKQACEIEETKRAIANTKKLYKVLDESYKKAESETELDRALRLAVIKHDTDFAYETILASGKNALTMHYMANNSPLDKKSQLLVDLGAVSGKYASDTSRTVFADPSKRQRQVYEAVESVLLFAISQARPGISLADLEQEILVYLGEKMREIGIIKTISNEQVHEFCPHLLMHHVGLDLHEPFDHKALLSPGSILAIEPGIYIADEEIAVRLEDMVLVTESGCQIITDSIPRKIDSFV